MPLILPSQRLIRPNPLAYPAGAVPGFDPSHIAARNCPFSGVASTGGTFGHVLSRVKGTEGGTKTTSHFSQLGPVTNYLSGSDSSIFPFASAAGAPITLAGIFKITSAPASSSYVLNNSAVGTVALGDGLSDHTFNGYCNTSGTAFFTTGIPFIYGVPWFHAASYSVSTISWVLVRMDTGQTWSASVANPGSAVDAGDGTITVGNRGNVAARQITGGIAAAMASNAFMSQQQLLAWAEDPWSFWYPNQTIQYTTPASAPIITTQYAAFYTPQHDGGVYTQMTGI